MQRQIDKQLWPYKNLDYVYVYDIIIFSWILTNDLTYLNIIFFILKEKKISIKSTKDFLAYSIIKLLRQKIPFGLLTSKKNLKTIVKLKFSLNLGKLKTYFYLIGWFCNYIQYYARISKLLKIKKLNYSFKYLKVEFFVHYLP